MYIYNINSLLKNLWHKYSKLKNFADPAADTMTPAQDLQER